MITESKHIINMLEAYIGMPVLFIVDKMIKEETIRLRWSCIKNKKLLTSNLNKVRRARAKRERKLLKWSAGK